MWFAYANTLKTQSFSHGFLLHALTIFCYCAKSFSLNCMRLHANIACKLQQFFRSISSAPHSKEPVIPGVYVSVGAWPASHTKVEKTIFLHSTNRSFKSCEFYSSSNRNMSGFTGSFKGGGVDGMDLNLPYFFLYRKLLKPHLIRSL